MLELLLVLLYTLLFLFIIKKTSWIALKSISNNWLMLFFLIKVAGAIGYGLLFEHHYQRQGDSWGYFYQGELLRELVFTDPAAWLKINFGLAKGYGIPEQYSNYFYDAVYWNNSGSNMMVRFTSIAGWFAFGKFYVLSVFSAFISFLGSWLTIKSVELWLPKKSKLLSILIFVFPSICFWGAGLHKEAWVIFSIGLIFYSLAMLHESFNIKRLTALIFGLAILFLFRNYYLFILIPGLIAYGICKYFPKFSFIKYAITYITVIAVGVLLVPKVSKNMDPMALLFIKHKQFQMFKGGANFEATNLEPKIESLIVNTPVAFYNSVFRPTRHQITKKMQWLTYVEVRIILLLIIFGALFFGWRQIHNKNLFLLTLFYSASVFWTIGMIVPNFGTIARYKSAILPVVFILIVMSIDITKAKKLMEKIGITS